jgi:hypothetical protein
MSGREHARIPPKAADLARANAEEIVRLESLDVSSRSACACACPWTC